MTMKKNIESYKLSKEVIEEVGVITTLDNLTEELGGLPETDISPIWGGTALKTILKKSIKELCVSDKQIREVLVRNGNCKKLAAEKLGISKSHVYRRLNDMYARLKNMQEVEL